MLVLKGILLLFALICIGAVRMMKGELSPRNYLVSKIAVGFVVLLIIGFVGNPLAIVSPGYRGVVVQLGAVKSVALNEGLNIIVPFVQKVEEVDCRIQKVEVDATAASKDMQQVHSKIAVNYRVKGDMAAVLYKNVGVTYANTIIAPAIQEAIKSITAKYTAEELIVKRQDVSAEIKRMLDSKVETYGITIDNFNIVNFDFSKSFNDAIEAKQTANQLALKAQQDLERIKIEAEQKVAKAKAEADALRLQKQEITPELLQLRQIEVQSKALDVWDGKLPNTYAGDAMPFIQFK